MSVEPALNWGRMGTPTPSSTPSCSDLDHSGPFSYRPLLNRDLSCGESDLFSGEDSNDIDEEDLGHSQAQSPRHRSPTPTTNPAGRGPLQRPPRSGQPFLLHQVDPELTATMRVLCTAERQAPVDPTYLTSRHGPAASPAAFIDAAMRRTAVSWLVEVAAEFRLEQDTLHLATALLDRFLSYTRAVPKSQLQLVAVACLLVASKHEEEAHPSAKDLSAIAGHCFTVSEGI